MAALFHDITERKRAEAEIEGLARFPAENPNPVLRLRSDGLLLYANQASDTLLKDWGCAVGEAAPEALQALVEEALDTKKQMIADIPQGERVWSFAVAPIVEMGYANLYGRDITERKRAEEALRESEERFRGLFESMHEGFVVCEPIFDASGNPVDFRYLESNPAFATMIGRRREEVVGHTYRELLPDGNWEYWVPRFANVALTGEPAHLEEYGAGSRLYYDLHAYRPRPGQFAAIFADVTERKRGEAVLQTTLQRLYALVSSMHGSVLLVGDDRVELANQAFCDYFGLKDSPADLIGLTPPETIDKIKQAYLHPDEEAGRIQEIVARGQPVIGEEIAMREGRVCLRDFIPISVDGKSYGRLWYHVDISERKRAEEALREHAQLLEYAPVFVRNLQDEIVLWNSGAEMMYGFSREEALGKVSHDLLQTVHPQAVADIRAALLRDGRWEGELQHRHKNGAALAIMSLQILHSAADGEPQAVIEISTDITRRKLAEEQLERLRSEFYGVISHELKTPLTAIKGSAAMALTSRTFPDTDEARELFETISDQCDRLTEMVTNLLDMTRIEAGTFSVDTRETDLAETIADALNIFKRAGYAHRTKVSLPAGLPTVRADRRRIVQVLTNLLTNAAKFSPPGLPIGIAAEEQGGQVVVKLRDQGAGIPAEKLPLLFQKFSQASRTEGRGHRPRPLDIQQHRQRARRTHLGRKRRPRQGLNVQLHAAGLRRGRAGRSAAGCQPSRPRRRRRAVDPAVCRALPYRRRPPGGHDYRPVCRARTRRSRRARRARPRHEDAGEERHGDPRRDPPVLARCPSWSSPRRITSRRWRGLAATAESPGYPSPSRRMSSWSK